MRLQVCSKDFQSGDRFSKVRNISKNKLSRLIMKEHWILWSLDQHLVKKIFFTKWQSFHLFTLFYTFQNSRKVFINFVCLAAHALTRVNKIDFSYIWNVLMMFTLTCSVLTMKCAALIVYLQGHPKEFCYITVNRGQIVCSLF